MICPKCGKEIDNGSVTCKFCGNNLIASKPNHQTDLLSDIYGVNKSNLYKEDNRPKEKKLLGLMIIGVVLLIIIVIAIVVTFGRK